jgi:hypothetical protein
MEEAAAAEEREEPAATTATAATAEEMMAVQQSTQQQQPPWPRGGGRRGRKRPRREQRPALGPDEQTLRIRVSEMAVCVGLHPFKDICETVESHVYQGASVWVRVLQAVSAPMHLILMGRTDRLDQPSD